MEVIMEFVILGLLIFSSQTIYELNANFEKGLSLIYAASYGNIQYAIKKLIQQEMIDYDEKVENGRNKKTYYIKEKGKGAFFQWMTKEIPVNKLETMFLAKVYFLGLIESKEEKLNIIEDVISKAEQNIQDMSRMKLIYENLELDHASMEIAKYQFKTLDYGLHAHSQSLVWIKELYQDIKSDKL